MLLRRVVGGRAGLAPARDGKCSPIERLLQPLHWSESNSLHVLHVMHILQELLLRPGQQAYIELVKVAQDFHPSAMTMVPIPPSFCLPGWTQTSPTLSQTISGSGAKELTPGPSTPPQPHPAACPAATTSQE